MALFGRKARTSTSTGTSTTTSTPEPEAPEHEDSWEQEGDEELGSPDAGGRVRAADLADGPFDAADAPDEDRIDLGGLQIPLVDGMELRLELDQRTDTVTGANLVIDGSTLQIQAFAAPKSRGLWDEVRSSLRSSVTSQGGRAEAVDGPFGPELAVQLPTRTPDGRQGLRPARFLGVDGPRWFLRAILSGPAASDDAVAARFERILSEVVVVRGSEAMAPQELIPLHMPGKRPGLVPAGSAGLDPLARGPEITQVGG